jgi:hypothetical protein
MHITSHQITPDILGSMTSENQTPVTGVITYVGIIADLPAPVVELVDGITERII